MAVSLPLLVVAACMGDPEDDLGASVAALLPTDYVVVDEWDPHRIGERTQLVARVVDADGNEVPGVEITWESSDPWVVTVTEDGRATVLHQGSAVVTAWAKPDPADPSTWKSGDLPLTPDDTDVIPRPTSGVMYTMWYARGGEAPVVLEDGNLRVLQDIYCPGSTAYTLQLCEYDGTDFDPEYLQTPWDLGAVQKFQWEGDRIGVLTDMDADTGAGTFRALDRAQEWSLLVVADARDFVLEGNRIGVIHADGTVRVKDGMSGAWTVLAGPPVDRAEKLVMEGDRIGIVYDDGRVRVKDGIHGTWTVLAGPPVDRAEKLVMEGNRIGIVYDDGRVRVKDGIHGVWAFLVNPLYERAADLVLEGNRIGVRYDDGKVRVKEGLSGAWTLFVDPAFEQAADLVMEGNRIGILYTHGKVWVKDGMSGAWVLLAGSGATGLALQEDFIGVVMGGNQLRIKRGLWGAFTTRPVTNMTQFRLIADVPSKPWRTGRNLAHDPNRNHLNYQVMRDACAADPAHCYLTLTDTWGMNMYGRYCGPDSTNLGGAMDPMDRVCLHHDNAKGFYEDWGYWTGTGDTCVVTAAIGTGKLTDATGAPTASWVGLEDVKAARDYYLEWADTWCWSGTTTSFWSETASRR